MRSLVLDNMQRSPSRVGLLATDRGFDVLHLVEYLLRDYLRLTKLRLVLVSDRAEASWRMAKVRFLEERVCEVEEDSDVLPVARARVDESRVASASLTTRTKQGEEERDTYGLFRCALEVA